MVVGRRQVDGTGGGGLGIVRQLDLEGCDAGEDIGEDGRMPRVQVLDNEYGHRKVGAERTQQDAQGVDTADGGGNGNDVEAPLGYRPPGVRVVVKLLFDNGFAGSPTPGIRPVRDHGPSFGISMWLLPTAGFVPGMTTIMAILQSLAADLLILQVHVGTRPMSTA